MQLSVRINLRLDIYITSDYGRIGPLHWTNSCTVPHQDLFTDRIVTSWGGCQWRPVEGTWLKGSAIVPFSA